MKVAMEDYPGFHERLSRLKEMEIGLDGAICAGGGEVRVHLPYIAACNQTLFNRFTDLVKQGKSELNTRNLQLKGIQLIVDYCYTGDIEITEDNFEYIIDAAIALEFLNIVEQCVQFALTPNVNVNIWCHFLRAAFKHPRSIQPNNFVPDLILHNITKIPREAIMKELDVAYIAEILEHGTVDDKDKCFAINLFLEMMLAGKSEIKNYARAIRRMKDLVRPGDNLIIPKDSLVTSTMSLMELSLEIDFTSLVETCVISFETAPPSTSVIVQILQWIKDYSGSQPVRCLHRICSIALCNLPMDVCEDDLCSMLQSNCLGTISEFDIFKSVLRWIEHNTVNANTKRKVIGFIRFGLMKQKEMDEIVTDFPVAGCEEIFYTVMRYHMRKHDQPLTVGDINKMRLGNSLVYVIGGKDVGNKPMKTVYLSRASDNHGNVTLSPFTESCQPPFAYLNSASTEMNGFIFVSGGEGASGAVNTLFRLDSHNNTWIELLQMGRKRTHHSLTSTDGRLVAVGGWDGVKALDDVDSYDVKHNTWTAMEPLPEGLLQHAASDVDGTLFTSGGSGTKTLLAFCDGVWKEQSPMLKVRQCHVMNGVSSMLFVVGGSIIADGRWSVVLDRVL